MAAAVHETDIHCVTKWSKLDTGWHGVPVRDVWAQIDPEPAATRVLVFAYDGSSANFPGRGDLYRPRPTSGRSARLGGSEVLDGHPQNPSSCRSRDAAAVS